jgi:hypothetical protein
VGVDKSKNFCYNTYRKVILLLRKKRKQKETKTKNNQIPFIHAFALCAHFVLKGYLLGLFPKTPYAIIPRKGRRLKGVFVLLDSGITVVIQLIYENNSKFITSAKDR